MSIELIGLISSKPFTDGMRGIADDAARAIDGAFIREFARAHEDADFDSVLIGYGSTSTDGFSVAAHAAAHTERLKYLIAHRPGFVAPTLQARKVAALDQLTGGRILLNIITGGNDVEQQREGDFLSKDERYARTGEFVDVLKRVWTSDEPFDYDGRFYQLRGAFAADKPVQKPYPPLYISGASGPAVSVGAEHADVYMMWGEPKADVAARIAGIRAEAARFGRNPRFSVSFRPILAATVGAAWDRAYAILERVKAGRSQRGIGAAPTPANVGSQRLLAAAEQGDIVDERLFTAIARETGAAGNSTALVGTPEQVAATILEYYDLGVTTILIRGYDPLPDAIDYGRELIPLVRAGVARRERQPVAI